MLALNGFINAVIFLQFLSETYSYYVSSTQNINKVTNIIFLMKDILLVCLIRHWLEMTGITCQCTDQSWDVAPPL